MNRRQNSRKAMRATVLALGAAMIAASAAAPAFADDWYRNDRAWREHEYRVQREHDRRIEAQREREWRERHAYAYDFRYRADPYYYTPRPIYPAPPYYVR